MEVGIQYLKYFVRSLNFQESVLTGWQLLVWFHAHLSFMKMAKSSYTLLVVRGGLCSSLIVLFSATSFSLTSPPSFD